MEGSNNEDSSTELESLDEAKEIVRERHKIIKSLVLDEDNEMVSLDTFEKRLEENGLTMFEGEVYTDDSDALAFMFGREALDLLREDKHPSVWLKDVDEEARELYRFEIGVSSIKGR